MFLTQVVLGQRTRADRFFEKGDFINAAKYYEEELEREYHKKAVENIAICYYNTFQYKKASRYLRQLVKGRFHEKDKSYDNTFNFKFYQVLSALGDYETGIVYLKQYKEQLEAKIDVSEAIDIIETFKLKSPDYEIKKTQFNSEASDFGALKLGDSIYFVSDRTTKKVFEKTYKWTHQSFLDIYVTQVNKNNDTIGYAMPLAKPLNSKLHDGNFCFSADGNTLYISRSNYVKGKKTFDEAANNNIHIYRTTRVAKDSVWSPLEKLLFNTHGFSYQHPALSPDETKLYFSSNRAGGYGSFDLYYAEINSDGTFGEPVNLGATINTENREHFPFISAKGHLFFASNGHLGLGMLDNFVSEYINNTFTKPINLGVPVNSPYDDFNLNYYNEQEGFFASNRKNKTDNIFTFKQTGEIFLREYINTFEVRDAETKSYIPNVNVVLLDKKDHVLYRNTLDSLAVFNMNILADRYQLKATHQDYKSNVLFVEAEEKQDQKHILYLEKRPPPPPKDPVEVIIEEKKIDKKLKQEDPKRFALLTDTEGPPVIEKEGKLFFELPPIYFDFNMWDIRADSKKVLDALAAKLERYPKIYLKISAHTDSRGTVRYNQILSERRAESTRNYLALEAYINAKRLKFQGYGELQPIVPCPMLDCTDEEHQLNRRSEFEIISYE